MASPSLVDLVQQRMQQMGITQVELAAACGLSQPHLSKVLANRVKLAKKTEGKLKAWLETSADLSVDNTNDFMAPEVLCGAEVSPESDLYSVGMVLYWALNERRIPFVPLPPTAVEASDLAIAREQRLRGDPLPEPLHGSQALKNVVMRACADDPAQRYASVEEFRAALLAVARRAAAAQPQQAQAVRRETPAPKAAAADTFPGSKPKAQRKAVPVETEDAEKPHNAKKTVAIILGSLVVVALIA